MRASAAADTIFAVAAGGRHAALTVLRVSGAGCAGVLTAFGVAPPAPRRASLRSLRDAGGRLLDRALVLWFPAPRSYTGEDLAEFHLHGGSAVLDGVAEALLSFGARPAEPGEFTRRGFVNGRIDLLEAEAIGDLVGAETGLQRDQALMQMQGAQGDIYAAWRVRLIEILAMVEAEIDFPEEVAATSQVTAVRSGIRELQNELETALIAGMAGERLTRGLTVAVVGAPNVGKSTLVNALCQREAAIVSSMPGTTRDVIEARLVLGGVPLTLLDTAGLRDTGDAVEREGMRRARARAEDADLVLLVSDDQSDEPEVARAGEGVTLRVRTKADLGSSDEHRLNVSATRGDGMERLRAVLTDEALRLARGRATPSLTRPRHRAAVTAARDHLRDAGAVDGAEFVAEELRLAMAALARVTGEVVTDDVLDLVFSRFCIGK